MNLLKKLLKGFDACDEAREWCEKYRMPAEAWEACSDCKWMLWALTRAITRDEPRYRLFACWCVRNTPLPDGRKVWDLLTDPRSHQAVEVAEAFAKGAATEQEMSAAHHEHASVWKRSYASPVGDINPPSRLFLQASYWANEAAFAASSFGDIMAANDASVDTTVAAGRIAEEISLKASATMVVRNTSWEEAVRSAKEAQSNALREIFGNPFADEAVLLDLVRRVNRELSDGVEYVY